LAAFVIFVEITGLPKRVGLFWIALVVILLFGNVFPVVNLRNTKNTSPISRAGFFAPAKTNHGPIAIDGDANFSDTALEEGWLGDGSYENPYIIDDLDIDLGGAAGHCINISNTRVNFTIQNCNLTVASAGAGIFLNNVRFGYLFNNTCSFNVYGVYLLQSAFNILLNNTCFSNSRGIYMDSSDFNTVSGNDCDDNNNYGIFLYFSDSNVISQNWCSSTGTNGIAAQSVVHCTIADNTCNHNGYGIRIWDYSSGNMISNNTCNYNSNCGIVAYNDDYALPLYIANNVCNDNDDGIDISGTTLFVMANELTDNLIYGIFAQCDESVISENSIIRSDRGIWLQQCSLNTLIQNELIGCYDGMILEESDENIISENSLTELIDNGIWVEYYSSMNIIYLNDISVDTTYFNDFFSGVSLDYYTSDNNVSLNYIHHYPIIYMSAAIRDNGVSNIIDRNWYEEYFDEDYNDDGFWDTPYSIAGSASNVDLRPLVYPPHAPVWTEQPTTQIIDYWGQSFYYDLNATAPTPITWIVNDTVHFTVDNMGIVKSKGDLPVGSYGIRIRVTNLYGIYTIGDFLLIVQEISLPEWIVGPTDHVVDYGNAFETGLIVTDESGIAYWSINDTSNFALTVIHLNVSGYNFGWLLLQITNTSVLTAGVYTLNVTAVDPYGNSLSGIFTVTILEAIDTTPPVWVIIPAEQTLPYGAPLALQLAAWDASGIGYGWVNDTVHFILDGSWIVRNATVLQPGVYWLEVRLYDMFDNYCSANLTVTVLESIVTTTTSTTVTHTTSTTTSSTTATTPLDTLFPLMTFALGVGLGGGVVTIFAIMVVKKRNIGK
jgi:parallel beta-helix repeat protein